MKITLVNYEKGLGMDGILSKYARMMERELIDLGHKVTISDKPEKADWNHHINYISYVPSGGKDSLMITHLTGDKNQTEEEKISLVKKQLKTAIGVCMNQEIKDKLVKSGCPKDKLHVVYHAHDSLPRRPRIIAICSNIYADGRKREDMLVKLVKSFKDKKEFIFRIMGKGWKPVLDSLADKGLQAQIWDRFMGDMYLQILNTSDYLLYTGDEDSLAQSVVDAKQAGLRIIAPPRKEFEIEFPFNNQQELNDIFKKMTENPVKDWTWENVAKQHAKIWKK